MSYYTTEEATDILADEGHGQVDIEAAMDSFIADGIEHQDGRGNPLWDEWAIDVLRTQLDTTAAITPADNPGRMPASQLREIRETLGYSARTLAAKLNIRDDTYNRWERGREPIPYAVPDELARIAREQAATASALADQLDP